MQGGKKMKQKYRYLEQANLTEYCPLVLDRNKVSKAKRDIIREEEIE